MITRLQRFLTALLLLLLAVTVQAGSGTQLIFVERDNLHTALIVPVDALLREAPELALLVHDDPVWFRIGWGEANYFGVIDRSRWAAIRALFIPTESVMEVASLNGPRSSYDDSYPLLLEQHQFRAFVRFIAASFQIEDGELTKLRELHKHIRYYPAHRRYSMFYTCNNWTAQALNAAGWPIGYRTAWLAGTVVRRLPH